MGTPRALWPATIPSATDTSTTKAGDNDPRPPHKHDQVRYADDRLCGPAHLRTEGQNNTGRRVVREHGRRTAAAAHTGCAPQGARDASALGDSCGHLTSSQGIDFLAFHLFKSAPREAFLRASVCLMVASMLFSPPSPAVWLAFASRLGIGQRRQFAKRGTIFKWLHGHARTMLRLDFNLARPWASLGRRRGTPGTSGLPSAWRRRWSHALAPVHRLPSTLDDRTGIAGSSGVLESELHYAQALPHHNRSAN